MAFDLTDPRTPSGRIEEDLLKQIAEGTLAPGDRIKPYAELAAGYGVDKNTAMAAVQRLRAKGVVYIKRGVGTFVIDQDATTSPPTTDGLESAILAQGETILRQLESLERRVAAIEERQSRED